MTGDSKGGEKRNPSTYNGEGLSGSRRGEQDEDGSYHFWKEFGYSWDAVMVLPIHPDVMEPEMIEMLEKVEERERTMGIGNIGKDLAGSVLGKEVDAETKAMQDFVKPVSCRAELPSAAKLVQLIRGSGFETYQYYTADNSMIIMKIRAPLAALRAHADLLSKPFLMDEDELATQAATGFEGTKDGKYVKIKPFTIYDGFDEGVTTLLPYQHIYGRWDSNVGTNLYVYEWLDVSNVSIVSNAEQFV